MTSSSAAPDESRDAPAEGGSPRPRRARGCLKRLAIFALIALPTGGWLINGPLFRAAAEWGIGKAATTQGLEGRATVAGTLLGGFGLKDVRFEGEGMVRRVILRDSEVKYHIGDLIAHGGLGWLEAVRFEDGTIELSFPEKSDSPAPDAEADGKEPPDLSPLWDLLGTRIEVRNLSVRIELGGGKVYEIGGASFKLAEDGKGTMGIDALTLPGQEPRRDIRTGIRVAPKNITLGPLAVFPEVELTALALQRPGGTEPLLSATLGLAGGIVEGTFDSGNRIAARLVSGEVDVPALLAAAEIDGLASAKLSALDLAFRGEFGEPASWQTKIAAEFAEIGWKDIEVDSVKLAGGTDPGNAGDDTLEATVRHGDASLEAEVSFDLGGVTAPAELADTAATVALTADVPAVAPLMTEFLPGVAERIPVTGAFGGTATVRVAERKLVSAEADLGSQTLAVHGIPLDTLSLRATTTGARAIDMRVESRLDDEASLELNGTLDSAAMTYGGEANISVAPAGKLNQLVAALGFEKEIAGKAGLTWRGNGDLGAQTHRGESDIDAAEIRIGGATTFSALLSAQYDGFDDLTISRFSLDSEPFQLEGALTWKDAILEIKRLAARGEGKPLLAGHLRAPLDLATVKSAAGFFGQEGDVDLEIASEQLPLATIMGFFHEKPPVACNVTLNLSASGPLRAPKAAGAVNVTNLVLNRDGALPPAATPLDLALTWAWQDGFLEVSRLEARGDGKPLLAGFVRAPFDPAKVKSAGDFFRQEGALDLEIKSEALPLATVMGLLRQESPVSCRVSANLTASGSPRNLEAAGAIRVSDLLPKGERKLPPAAVALDVAISEQTARVTGELSHPQINPLRVQARVPFRPGEWVEGKAGLLDEPLAVTAKMTDSPLAFLAGYAPGIRSLEGVISLDARIDGTLREPKAGGGGSIRASQLRLDNPAAPSIRDLETLFRFEERQLRIEKLGGLVAGGRLDVSGTAGLPAAADGVFTGIVLDLTVDGDEVLIARSENLSLRANLDLALSGAWESARLTGQIGITGSRVFKDINLVPSHRSIAGGGTAIPEVEPGPSIVLPKRIDVGVPLEPFDNWEVDVKLVTLDPFVVGGNLMRARIHSDLGVSGTLGTPAPDGRVWMEEGVLRLPFSRVEVSEAAVEFSERTGFNGRIRLKANSTVGNHRVSIYGSSRVLDPRIVFSSVPPLPREDILTLIGTGTTRAGLTGGYGSGTLLKSLLLLFQGATATNRRVDPEAEPGFFETIGERASVDVGKVNPETGYRSNGGLFRLWKGLFAGGSIDETGGYRGILKYVFRLR